MAINEKLFSSSAVRPASGPSDGITDAKNVLWCFPAGDQRARRGRELGQQLVAMVFLGDIGVILAALLFTFYVRFRTPIREWGINAPPEISEYYGYIVLALILYVGMLSYGGYQRRKLLQLWAVTARI